MNLTLLALLGLIAMALLFDYTNGFHDSANSIATVVATRVLKPRWAVAWAALFNFIAFLVLGTAVANTIGQTIKTQYFGLPVVFAALLGAICWNYLSWHFGLPTSSSHALVGGLVGAGLARGGWDAIKAASVEKTALFIVISPIAGLLLGAIIMGVLRLILAKRDVTRTERGFRWAQLASSAAVSLGHGGNDAQKTMGVVAALLVSTGYLHSTGDKLPIPLWVVLAAHAAIAAGTLSGGWRIVRTMGLRITQLRPVSGFSAETAAAIALFASTAIGAPVSTTHTVAGAITGVGTTNRATTVNWKVFGRVALAWLITLPFAAVTAAIVFWLATGPPRPVSVVIMVVLLATLVFLLIRSIRRAPTASDMDAETESSDDEIEFPFRPGTGSLIPARRARSTTDPASEHNGQSNVPDAEPVRARSADPL